MVCDTFLTYLLTFWNNRARCRPNNGSASIFSCFSCTEFTERLIRIAGLVISCFLCIIWFWSGCMAMLLTKTNLQQPRLKGVVFYKFTSLLENAKLLAYVYNQNWQMLWVNKHHIVLSFVIGWGKVEQAILQYMLVFDVCVVFCRLVSLYHCVNVTLCVSVLSSRDALIVPSKTSFSLVCTNPGLAIWGDRSLSLIDRLNTRQAIEFLIAY